jgi:hypothetical protein
MAGIVFLGLAVSDCRACNRGILAFESIGPQEGNPFSAEKTSVTVETLADGTKRTMSGPTTFVARDGAGRIRIEHMVKKPDPNSADAEMRDGVRDIVICDAATGTTTHIMGTVHAAQIAEDPTPAPAPYCHDAWGSWYFPGERAKALPANIQFEDLGYKDYEGMVAHVARTTTLSEPDANGERTPIKIDELWISEELHATVLEIHTDLVKKKEGRIGFAKLVRTGPDPALFEIPQGYAIEKVPPQEMLKPPRKPGATPATSPEP